MKYKVTLIAMLFWCLAIESYAGLKWVDIGVNGLTCSMCTRSVEMSLRRLDFVDSVAMSLETTDGRIYFKDRAPVNLSEVVRAVTNAGFSVRFVKLQMSFDDIVLSNDGSFVFQGQTYKWLDFRNQVRGTVSLKIVDEHFLPKKERTELIRKFNAIKDSDQKILHVVQG